MMWSWIQTSFRTTFLILFLFATVFAANGKDDNKNVPVKRGPDELVPVAKFDLSPPLKNIPPARQKAGVKRVVPNRPLPKVQDTNAPVTAGQLDPVMQMSAGPTAAPTGGGSFDGVGDGFTGPQGTHDVNVAPPDPVHDVGPNHIVHAVNSNFAILNKTGTVVYGPVALNTLWSGFGGRCQSDNDGDPTVNYDQIANRWVIAQFAVSATPYTQCVAVSQTSDPLGAWYRFAYTFTDFNDYPKVGIWPDGYYITYNMFTATSGYGKVCALDRTKLLAGQANTQQCFNTSTNIMGLLPTDMDGSNQPAAGSPNYVFRFDDAGNRLQMWKFAVNWTTPASSTFTGPTNIAVAAFAQSCPTDDRGACIPQAGTTSRLEALADRLMNRLAYRRFGAHESLVASHTVGSDTSAQIRWYEIRNPNGTPTVHQQGTYAPNTNFRWMPSIAMDQVGNIGVGYSLSSSSISPDIYFTGRESTDPLGTLGTETTMLSGVARGSQIGTYGTPPAPLERWGDYSALVLDPSDDCTFWFTSEYIPSNGIFNWRTRIASFKFASCAATGGGDTTPPTTSVTAPAGGSTLTGTVTVSANASDNVGVTNVEFYANAALIGSDSSAPYSVSWNTATVANGSYNLTSKAFDAAGNNTTSSPVSVTVNNVAGPPALTATYNSTLRAPACVSGGKSCDTGTSLINGRGTMSPAEPNQPNTINNSCADGSSGTYHTDESLDRLMVATNDSTALAGGKAVTVSATVWCWGTADALDLYYTSNAATPTWTLIGTQNCTVGGQSVTLTGTYTLPSTGTQHAIRGQFRYQGSASTCTSGSYNDRDDLIFGVNQTADTTAPTTSITAPANGATVANTITVSANATDNVGVTRVEFYRDGTTLLGTDTTSPYSISWNTTTTTNGAHTLTSRAYDAANNVGTSAVVNVNVSNATIPALTATYNTTFQAPACGSGGKSCDTGASLINGRGTMTNGNETNRPNTINSTCVDGNSGSYHVDESIDRMSIATNDGTALASGKTVTVSVTVWCYDSTDRLDLYRTATAATPSWTLIGTQACTAAGARTFTATYTLPTGTNQAVRGNFRYGGSASTCTSGGYNDRDDLVFGVQ